MPRAKRSKEPLPEKAIVLMVGDQLHKQASDLYTARFHVEVAMAAAKRANARKRLRSTLKIVLRGLEVDHKLAKKKLEKLNGTRKAE